MIQTALNLTELYLEDETAWLEAMAELIAAGNYSELDFANLRELLLDMSRRDRREVESRFVILLLHILKWEFQPEHRSRSWLSSIIEQRQELSNLASRGILRQHAETVLPDVYRDAIERASAETGLPMSHFPAEIPYTVEELLHYDATM